MECSITAENKSIQDDDIALARLLQEQERALFLFGRPSSTNDIAGEELTDEELARRLQEEEDQAAYQALAYGSLGDGGGLLPDNEREGADRAQSSEVQDQSSLPFSYEDMLALGDIAGKVSKGFQEDALSRLPVTRVCSLREANSVLTLDRCCICQLEFEADEDATPLPCRHCYHSDCVRQWLQQSRTCPVCGIEVELSNPA